jgi:hypothetical protein
MAVVMMDVAAAPQDVVITLTTVAVVPDGPSPDRVFVVLSLSDANRKFLEAALRYYDLSQTTRKEVAQVPCSQVKGGGGR